MLPGNKTVFIIKALNPFKDYIAVEIIHLCPSEVFLKHGVFLVQHPSKGGGNKFHGVHCQCCFRLQGETETLRGLLSETFSQWIYYCTRRLRLYICIADIQNHNCFKSSFSIKLKDVSIVYRSQGIAIKHTPSYILGLYYYKEIFFNIRSEEYFHVYLKTIMQSVTAKLELKTLYTLMLRDIKKFTYHVHVK